MNAHVFSRHGRSGLALVGLVLVLLQLAFAQVATQFSNPLASLPTPSGRVGEWSTSYCGNHLGVDLPSPAGTPVKAIGDGTVAYASTVAGLGTAVHIQHRLADGSEITSVYYHTRRVGAGGVALKVGATVHKGDTIAYLTDRADDFGTAPHLHFGIRRGPYQAGTDSRTAYWFYPGYTHIRTSPCQSSDPMHQQITNEWVKDPIGFISSTPAITPAAVPMTVFSNFSGSACANTCSAWDTGKHTPEQPYHRGMAFAVPPGGADFTLASITLPAFNYWLSGPGQAATLIVSVTADSGGLPGAVLERFTFPNIVGGSSVTFLTGSSILHPTLAAGNQYWLTTEVSDPLTMSVGWPKNDQGSTGLVAWSAGTAPWSKPFGDVPQTLAAFSVTGIPK